MDDFWIADRLQVRREIAHWSHAIAQMRYLDLRASDLAWRSLERYLGIAIQQRLLEAVDRLEESSQDLRLRLEQIRTLADHEQVRVRLLGLRRQYLQTETTLDFFADALNTRTNERMAQLLTACDTMARRSMCEVLSTMGYDTPPVLTYIDKGLGASILKMGLRLWDGGTINPVAVIKVVFHNLMRPTSIIHEAGHQVAHILGWNEELRDALQSGLSSHSSELAEVWSSWASEIAADAFAFVHTGYAAVASLHDVLSGGERFVYRFLPGDPHPISYIRVLLGTAMCRLIFGPGEWDVLDHSWLRRHILAHASSEVKQILQASLSLLPQIVAIILKKPMTAFGKRTLVDLINPMRVQPKALLLWEREIGSVLYQSPYWIGKEPVRLLALSGYHVATRPQDANQIMRQHEGWMLRLGAASNAYQYMDTLKPRKEKVI